MFLRFFFLTLLASIPTIAWGQAFGPEFQVNITTVGGQRDPSVASGSSGNFVVVWESSGGQDGSGIGVFGRRFDAAGNPLSGEFQINTSTAGDQADPEVASDPAGNFVVVWESADQDGLGVYGQRFAADGTAMGSEFQVNSFTLGDQDNPAVAMDALGNFVVVWDSAGQDGDGDGVFGQRFTAAGLPEGVEFQVNTTTVRSQSTASVTADATGFVVVWESRSPFPVLNDIFGQRYDASGVPVGTEFLINTNTTGGQENPSVDSDALGNFVVVWRGDTGDGDGRGIFGQRFDAAANPTGMEFLVNTFTTGDQQDAHVATDDEGNFVVVWESDGQDGAAHGVFAQRFDASGDPLGPEFQVNTTTLRNQDNAVAAVALGEQGRMVVVWESQQITTSDEVIAQLFHFGVTEILTGGPDEDSDGKIDVAVEVRKQESTLYEFEVFYSNPDGPDVVILKTIPAEWNVNEAGGSPIIDGSSGGPVSDGMGGLVDVFPANKKANNKSATKIEWTPDPSNDSSTLAVQARTRERKSKMFPKFAPTSCGILFLNEGVKVFELDPLTGESLEAPPLFERGPLFLVAVEDLNGGGIVGDGSGDEDGDGRTDLEEVSGDVFTDPCLADTDGDGVNDNLDQCPLQGLEGTGSVDPGGCPITPEGSN